MATFTQDHRPLQITTPLPANALLLEKLTGTEAISTLFQFHFDLLAPDPIEFGKIVGQNVTASLQLAEGGTRYFSGIVRRFQQGNRVPGAAGAETFLRYRAEVVPQLWLLTRTRQSRIFTNQSVPDILKTVLAGLNVTYELTGSYDPRNYCVQYRESDFAFASRLMEEEGIFYFFKHEQGKHALVLSDANLGCPKLAPETAIYEPIEDSALLGGRVTSWEKNQEVGAGKFTLWDHCFELPGQHLDASTTLQESVVAGTVTHPLLSGANRPLEVYDYPGGYAKRFDGVSPSGGAQTDQVSKNFTVNQHAAKLRMEEEAAHAFQISGESTYGAFTSGYEFQLSRHFDADGTYVMTRVEHQASISITVEEMTLAYSNRFECIPAALPYRPQRVTPTPRIDGTQTATVVSVEGEDPSCDKYGRIKVQFNWDRDGASSCWLRVGQPWAGQTWGAHHVPRKGQEVIVAFHDGDPDCPICLGSVYNAAQMPPYTMPDQKMQSGLVSSSGGSENFHEIRLDDTSGKEVMLLHSERDLVHESENDHTMTVGNNQSVQVANNHQMQVGNYMHIVVGGGSGGGGGPDWVPANNPEYVLEAPNILTICKGYNNTLTYGECSVLVGGALNTSVLGMNSTFNFVSVWNITLAFTVTWQAGGISTNLGSFININTDPVAEVKTNLSKLEGSVKTVQGDVQKVQGSITTLEGDVQKVQGTITKEIADVNKVIATKTEEVAAENKVIAAKVQEIGDKQVVIGNKTEEIGNKVAVIGEQTKTFGTKEEIAASVNQIRGEISQVAATADMGVAAYTQLGEMFQL